MDSKQFKEELKSCKDKVDLEVMKLFLEKKKQTTMIKEYELLERFVINGGKRLRPLIMLKAYEGYGGKKNIIRESLSIELLHNSTLVEDDVMDEDEIRRNEPTIYKIFKDKFLRLKKEKKYNGSLFNRESSRHAVSNSMILGNILYSLGFDCIIKSKENKDKVNECIKRFNESFIRVNEGQFYDLAYENKKQVLEEEYIQMVEYKSSYIVRIAAEIGGVLAGAKKEHIDALSKFLKDIIVSFQIRDDLMDIDESLSKGHEVGSDIKQGKRTLLVIKALEMGNLRERKKILTALGKENATKKQVKTAIEALYYSGAVQYCQDYSEQRIFNAKKILEKTGLNKDSKEFFSILADYMISRTI